MGIIGADYKFLWTSARLPDSLIDSCTFQAFRLYEIIVVYDFLPEIKKNQ